MMAAFDPGCNVPPSIPNAHPTGEISTTPVTYVFTCDSGYTMSGSPTFICNSTGFWIGNGECQAWDITNSTLFWALVAVGIFLVTAGLIAFCVCCTRPCFRRRRVRPSRPRSSGDDKGVGCCGGCCDFGGSCDTCGCIDYHGHCSLYGFCGYKGRCSFCGCCRCCREPDLEHVHSNIIKQYRTRNNRRGRRIDKVIELLKTSIQQQNTPK